MIRLSPAVRISIGLVFITISFLLLGSFVGLIPDRFLVTMEARKSIAESLAAQCTLAARYKNLAAIRETMDVMVKLHEDLVSMGMRNAAGRYIAQTAEHNARWVPPTGEASTPTHWQVPLYQNGRRASTMELSFSSQDFLVLEGYHISPFTVLLVLFALLSFIAFFIYMKKTLRHLDPTTVMPKRVKSAFDTLTEGVIIMDAKERIILANRAFADNLGCTVDALMGLQASQLDWINPETNSPVEAVPWAEVMTHGMNRSGVPLNIARGPNEYRSFMANVSPIVDGKGRSHGALATFDDVTELQNKNTQLSEMLKMLEESNHKIEIQNRKLEILATEDSLTGCLNRRAFFEKAEQRQAEAAAEGSLLACIMLDIDFFKSINDNYGHAVGDRVLQFFSRNLRAELGSDDALCRYGGEEFCILLAKSDIEKATETAERIRTRIAAKSVEISPEAPEISLSASFGVSASSCGAEGIDELLGRADRALYEAKGGGRNRVVVWDRAREIEFLKHMENRRVQRSPINV